MSLSLKERLEAIQAQRREEIGTKSNCSKYDSAVKEALEKWTATAIIAAFEEEAKKSPFGDVNYLFVNLYNGSAVGLEAHEKLIKGFEDLIKDSSELRGTTIWHSRDGDNLIVSIYAS